MALPTQQNLRDLAQAIVYPPAPTTYPVTADPTVSKSLPDDYSQNTYVFTVSAVAANYQDQDLFCFHIAPIISNEPGYTHNSSKTQGWSLVQFTANLQPTDPDNFQIWAPSLPETYQETEQVTKGISYNFNAQFGYSKDGASVTGSAGMTYSDSITYGLPDVDYENQSSGGVFEVVVNVRGPEMDKELFTGGLRAPAQSGTASFQPTFGVIFWANSGTRVNAESQAFTLTFTLVYAYRVATSTTTSDLHHATYSRQFSFTVANPPEVASA